MSQKAIILLAIVLLVAAGAFLLLKSKTSTDEQSNVLDHYTVTEEYSTNTVLTDSFTILAGEAVVLKNDSTLTAQNDITIDGALGCQDGSLTLISNGTLHLNDTIVCQGDTGGSVTIVATNGLVMAPSARIIADGDVQIVDGTDVVRTKNELNQLFDAVETIPDAGIVVGPLVDEETPEAIDSAVEVNSNLEAHGWQLIPRAHAQINNGTTTVNQSGQPIVVSGTVKINSPRKGAKRIVVFDFPNTPEVTIQNFQLEGPNGRKGDPDSSSCNVVGKDGEDAFRFNALAPSLIVNNFTLTLGDGGEGGDATTSGECDDAKATGGNGGKPGNFRMIGSQNFEIRGAFEVHPGDGGAGGGATANGKVGEPGEKGGDANATGGAGGHNKKKLTVSGTVAGTSNVKFGDAVGGPGGFAFAEGGTGGAAKACGETGGQGGNATAKSGRGGDAKLTVSGGASRMAFANDIGGQGGMVEAYGGVGGVGGSCDETAKGGDGGQGGTASATEGKGGFGKSGRANDGAMFGNHGGNGGVGGDGCTEGSGGPGGSGGLEDGEKGEDGRNICLSITKEEDYISLVPGEIQVIKHKDYYIPITNLQKFTDPNGEECDGEEHWHPGANGAINLRGMAVPDPDPNNCGFGKTSEVEVHIVDDPNYQPPANNSGQGGEMIQIDPPTLVIPAQ